MNPNDNLSCRRFYSFRYLLDRLKKRGLLKSISLFWFECYYKIIRPALSEIWSLFSFAVSKNLKQSDILYAFYDLEVAPPTFDILLFLLAAEVERGKKDCEFIHVVIVPGKSEGFRKRDLREYIELGGDYDIDTMRWRVRNISVPSCWHLASSQQITVCATRKEAKAFQVALAKNVFPKNYTVDFPISNHDPNNIYYELQPGGDFAVIRPNPQAVYYLKEWVKIRSKGRKMISITLRECYDPIRNSNLSAWSTFAKNLDPSKYWPVIVRDTEAAMKSIPQELEGLTIFPEASWSLELRAALYDQSYLNLGVSNGPVGLFTLSKRTRYLLFQNIISKEIEEYYTKRKIQIGSQLPFATPFQRLVWERDKLDIIQREFKMMCEMIEKPSKGS